MSDTAAASPVARDRERDRALSLHRAGIRYRSFLGRAVEALGARSYFEIGTASGGSLSEIGVFSVAVDPQFKIDPGTDVIGRKPGCLLFQMTADDFFAQYKLADLLPAPHRLDFAFLDGMHHFEFLLRDFFNTEANSHEGTVIVMHDCIPVNPQSTFRQGKDRRRPIDHSSRRELPTYGGWAGDVWKIVPLLREFRPDLKISFFDALPTGLVVVQGLNPGNDVLRRNYDDIVKRYMDVDLVQGWYDEYIDSITLKSSAKLGDPEVMRAALAA